MPKGLIDVIEQLLESHDGKVKDSGDANTGDHRSSKVEADKGPHNMATDNANDVGGKKGDNASAASSKIDANKGPHSQASDNAGDTNSIDGRKAKPSGASSKVEADKGPHNQATDCFEDKDEEQDDELGDIKSKFNKLIDAEKDEPEHDDDDLEKVKEQHDIHIHIGDHGGSKTSKSGGDSKPSKAPAAPAGGRGDEGGDESGGDGGDEIPADRGDAGEKDRNPSLNTEATDKKDFAALAAPKDKITFADKLAGIKKKGGMKEELKGNQDKIDANKNGKIDGDDFKILRGEKKKGMDEAWPGTPGGYQAGEAQKKKQTPTGYKVQTKTGTKHVRTKYDEAAEMYDAVVAEMVSIIGEEYLDEYLAEGSVEDFIHEDDMERFADLQLLAVEIEEAMKKMKDEDVHLHLDGGDKEEGGDDKGGDEGGDKEPEMKGSKIPPKEPTKDVDPGASKPSDEGGDDEGGEKKNPFAEGKTFRRNDDNSRKNAQQKQRQQQQAAKRARRMGEAVEDGDMEETKHGKSPDQGPHDMSADNAGDMGKSPTKGSASSKVEGDKGPHSQASDNAGDTNSIDGKNAKASGASSKVEADKGPVNQSGENKSFKEEADLNEEFREKARVIFETAVNEKVASIEESLIEQYNAALAEEINAMQDVIAETVAESIREWLEANQLEIKYSLRTEIAENFIRGMRNLVAENYIEIPPEEVSIVDELSEAVEDFKARDVAAQDLIEELQSEILAMRRDSIISRVAEDLTETQKLKLAKLAENVEATSIEEFESKLNTLKETYFAEGFDNSALLSSLSEGVIGVGDNYVDSGDDTSVSVYAEFLSKTSKK